ncbi:MAG: homoserine dehydrogenase [Lachnospiraceae bacterium]|nr:homoserine dehydrogenase [Lachnospiraceae bacterium]MBP3609291.1 homoserine dehydrogenase [Lachnospiraceae bacterium]
MKIAVLGYGTIGSGVVEVLERNGESIAKRAGEEITVKYVLDLREFPGSPIEDMLVHEFSTIAEDEEVGCVVETMGGIEPAYSYVKECLLRGKSVCTSNKALVAKHGAELLEIARQKKINFLFEASVGGGIPIIRPLNQSLTSEEILEITGIVNGTTNYILTKMSQEGATFEAALKEAQDLGYAERNPEADVEGHDAGRKLAILASLSYGMQVDFEDIYMEGITKITDTDFKYAEVLGAEIKLLAQGKKVEDKFYAMVTPKMIREDNPLYSVRGVFNSILVKGNTLGDVMFYGSGAGKLPTASAVVADVIDATKHWGTNITTIWSSKKLALSDHKEAESGFFVRVPEAEEAKAREVFGEVEEVKLSAAAGVVGEFAFLTKKMSEKAFEEKAAKVTVLNRIRTEWTAE